jgi:hypothetical protein
MHHRKNPSDSTILPGLGSNYLVKKPNTYSAFNVFALKRINQDVSCSREWGLLSLVSTIEEILERKNSGFSLENREYGRRDLSR